MKYSIYLSSDLIKKINEKNDMMNKYVKVSMHSFIHLLEIFISIDVRFFQ